MVRLFKFNICYLLIFFSSMYTVSANQPAILFISHDRGESNNFKALTPLLKKHHLSYKIIGFGQALQVFKQDKYLIPLKTEKTSVLSYKIRHLANRIRPQLVVAGMSSVLQAELLNFYKNRYKSKITTIAYYDNFDPMHEKDFVHPFLKKINKKNLDIVLVPLKPLIVSTKQIFPNNTVLSKGSPALTLTKQCHKDCFTNEQLRHVLGYHDQKPIILFAGDASKDYPTYAKKFIAAIAPLTNQYHFIITYHPKTSGALEKKLLRDANLTNVKVFNPTQKFSTFTLAKVAQLIIVHVSSVGSLLSIQCKPVVYFANSKYKNIFLQQQLARPASTQHELRQLIQQYRVIPKCYTKLMKIGLTNNARLATVNYLQSLL